MELLFLRFLLLTFAEKRRTTETGGFGGYGCKKAVVGGDLYHYLLTCSMKLCTLYQIVGWTSENKFKIRLWAIYLILMK